MKPPLIAPVVLLNREILRERERPELAAKRETKAIRQVAGCIVFSVWLCSRGPLMSWANDDDTGSLRRPTISSGGGSNYWLARWQDNDDNWIC